MLRHVSDDIPTVSDNNRKNYGKKGVSEKLGYAVMPQKYDKNTPFHAFSMRKL